MFQYGEAILVRPVVQYFGNKEDGDVLLPCRLWCEKVVALQTQKSAVPVTAMVENNEPWSVTRPDSTALGIFSFQYCAAGYIVRNSSYFGKPEEYACTSTASCTTGSRSWTTKRRCGWCLASAKDTAPTPPPTSTISEPSGSCPQAYPADVSIVSSWCSKVTQPERTFENDLRWVHILHAIHASPESGKTQSVSWRLEPGPYVFLDIVCSVKGSLV